MNDRGNIVIYQTKDGKTSIDVKLEDETVWLTQAQMAELFQKDRTVIGRHINNVYREGELERDITCAKFAHMGSYPVNAFSCMHCITAFCPCQHSRRIFVRFDHQSRTVPLFGRSGGTNHTERCPRTAG